MNCYIIKVETESDQAEGESSEEKQTSKDKKEQEPMDVYFGCVNDVSQITFPKRTYSVDKNGKYQVSCNINCSRTKFGII